jgi:aspartyl-tRNA synthetase
LAVRKSEFAVNPFERPGETALIRIHTCGQLRSESNGQQVTLCGWVDSYHDHGGGIFIDLRDRCGKTQIVFGPEIAPANQEPARSLRSEFAVSVTGKVARRPQGTVNPKLATGEIEVHPQRLVVLNKSVTPPFQPGGMELPNNDNEDLRRSSWCSWPRS